MKKLNNVVSLFKPKKVSKEDNIVKVRDKILPVTIVDEVFYNKKQAYMYDEKHYTEEEYKEMKLEERIEQLEERVQKTEEELEIIELAVHEFINSMIDKSPIELATIYKEYSAISQMYANMIKKGIFTLEKVPAMFRAEVEAVLKKEEENKE